MKAIILGVIPTGESQLVAAEEFPTVIVAGLTDQALEAIRDASDTALGPVGAAAAATFAGAGDLRLWLVSIEEQVTVGDQLEMVSSLFKKHV
jgi:hypothetical protein